MIGARRGVCRKPTRQGRSSWPQGAETSHKPIASSPRVLQSADEQMSRADHFDVSSRARVVIVIMPHRPITGSRPLEDHPVIWHLDQPGFRDRTDIPGAFSKVSLKGRPRFIGGVSTGSVGASSDAPIRSLKRRIIFCMVHRSHRGPDHDRMKVAESSTLRPSDGEYSSGPLFFPGSEIEQCQTISVAHQTSLRAHVLHPV